MKLKPSNPACVAASRPSAAHGECSLPGAALSQHAATACSAFTMVEIALCLAIVGFALVAIIGVLPAGLNVQKLNREETIINHEASLWMDALRSGSFGYDELTKYVDRVVVLSENFNTNGSSLGTVVTVAERNVPTIGDNNIAFNNSGSLIVGLLSTPRIAEPTPNAPGGAAFSTNFVYAYVRALSGSAADKAPQDDPAVKDLAFSYRMVVETIRANTYHPGFAMTNDFDLALHKNLADVRLLFRWPLKQPFDSSLAVDRPLAGTGRLVYRTELSGDLLRVPNGTFQSVAFYFLQPRNYTR